MFRSLVAGLVQAFALPSSQGPALPKNIHYVTFMVQDKEAAAALYDWYTERTDGLKVIGEFVRENFTPMLMRRECPYYFLDNEGTLKRVAYTGHVPEGWGGIPDTHWLEPKTGDAARQVDALPKPSLKKLHEIVDWPTLEEEWFHSHEQEIIRGINHMIRVYNDGQATYINVPHPNNFSDFPRIKSQLDNWQNPAWLVETSSGVAPAKQMVAAI